MSTSRLLYQPCPLARPDTSQRPATRAARVSLCGFSPAWKITLDPIPPCLPAAGSPGQSSRPGCPGGQAARRRQGGTKERKGVDGGEAHHLRARQAARGAGSWGPPAAARYGGPGTGPDVASIQK
ncbi:unnamed protein product [Calypogeia fissa]